MTEPITSDAVRYYAFWGFWIRVALSGAGVVAGAGLTLLFLIWRKP